MDRIKQKMRKEKPQKQIDKDSNTNIADIKSIKENLKIREILRTVKMNSSMRVKAPRGSKVMNNKDFNDNEEIFDEDLNSDLQNEPQKEQSPSATNHNVIFATNFVRNETNTEDSLDKISVLEPVENFQEQSTNPTKIFKEGFIDNFTGESSTDIDHPENEPQDVTLITPDYNFDVENTRIKNRDRKLSLDQTMLTRLEGLSRSELDLHSIGKSPLERKSSFFRKKMDSFFKNTTEIFKKQSMSNKPQLIQRRGSMSVSLQSLNEKTGDYNNMMKNIQGSMRSLHSSSTIGRSSSSLSASQPVPSEADSLTSSQQLLCSQPGAVSETDSLAGSQPLLSTSQDLAHTPAGSMHSLNEGYAQESMLNSRAISMSSGLDSAHATRRRKSSNRSNRVTWVASEGLSSYFRRLIQDEKGKEMQSHSYSDFSTIPEWEGGGERAELRGRSRRLSYQRAVSGEDASTRRKHLAQDSSQPTGELANLLGEFTQYGVPPLRNFTFANVPDEALAYLAWAQTPANLEQFYDWKKLSPNEESRQAVIRELITTEAVHIKHLKAVVEVFIAAAHALQDSGKLLDIDTERLFANIPDVLNASLIFWDTTIYPMVVNAYTNITPFNTELMVGGFCHFREIFTPYEKFVSEQKKALDYLRSLANHTDFMMYLSWCHSQKECNRLQLADILVKPMQRLTKYSLILRRIISYTEVEPDRTSLIAMIRFTKNYVLDLNRTIRQREELEQLDILNNSIESYEIDFKDEDLDRYFRMFSQINLKAPMLNSLPSHSRTLIFQGDLRYKDKDKEMEVRVFLLTDMILITKKQSKGNLPFKMIRPKFMVDKLIHFTRAHPRNPKEVVAIVFVALDDVGSSYNGFTLSETQKEKDPNTQYSLKVWEQKIREAKLSYDIGVWFAKNPSRDLSEVEMDSSSDYGVGSEKKQATVKQNSEDHTIERDARERVAVMLHRSIGTSTEGDYSQASINTDSFDGGARPPGLHTLRHPMYRTSTGGSSRNSRLSSFQQSHSATSHDEPGAGPAAQNIYRAGSSVEHHIPPLNPDDAMRSITVNVVSESESESVVSAPQQVTPQRSGSGSRSPASVKTLRVSPQSGVLALMHSLPDLTVEPSTPRPPPSPSPQTASEKLYQSHHELLQRNRLSAQTQHYLTPNHRGTSYPPPSPTRAYLKRGLAFSYSFKNPPLTKMGHVYSQSQIHGDGSPSHAKGESRSPTPTPMPPPPPPPQPEPVPEPAPVPGPAPSSDKPEKKKHFLSRNKGGSSGSGITTGAGATGKTDTPPTAASGGESAPGTSSATDTGGITAIASTSTATGTSSAANFGYEIQVIGDTATTSEKSDSPGKAGPSAKGTSGKSDAKGKGKAKLSGKKSQKSKSPARKDDQSD